MASGERVLVTGGAGFIGCHVAAAYLRRDVPVTLLDSFARPGVRQNAEWLAGQGGPLTIVEGDVRDWPTLRDLVPGHTVVYHLAAQVAVTTSVSHPRYDFETNALGTFNVLEAARLAPQPPIVVYASTNKVYGGMEDVAIERQVDRYVYRDHPHGIPETQPLDFHSPYGCSKGAGDQYVRDYARIYGLRTIVCRQSCIYGTRQFGTEDQGWVAHFAIAALLGRPLTIYGDGRQVRDILYIDDLLDLYERALARVGPGEGLVYNVGGGPTESVSLLEFVAFLEGELGRKLEITFADWRPGDQRVYISDIRKAQWELGWRPRVSKAEGLRRLWDWVESNRVLVEAARSLAPG